MQFSKETRVFVTGCGGMLGAAVYAHFSPISTVLATDIDLNEPWLESVDVRDYWQVMRRVHDFRPHLIINLAAMTDLETCERNPEDAWLTNALGAENVGLVASALGITYVYVSTAGVFDGKRDVYTDFDLPNPLSHYARSKYHGEAWTTRSVERHFVLRAGWMMGGGRKDKKFIGKVRRQIDAGVETIYAVTDKLGTPTYTVDFACGIQRVVESEAYGLYNQVCVGTASRYGVAVALVDALGLSDRVYVKPVRSDHFAAEYFAMRPASEQLVNMKLRARGLDVMRDWRICLKEYIKENGV